MPQGVYVRKGQKSVEPMEMDQAKLGDVSFDESNSKLDAGSDIAIQGDLVNFNEKAAKLALMEEQVRVIIYEDTNQNNPEPMVFLAVNGEGAGPHKTPWVPRGVEITIKRKFVERLLRAKPVSFKSSIRQNAMGEKESVYSRSSALKYPFSVIHDDNPRGPAWMKQVMAEAA